MDRLFQNLYERLGSGYVGHAVHDDAGESVRRSLTYGSTFARIRSIDYAVM